MEKYFESKAILFQGSGTEPPRVAVVNIDDEYGKRIIKLCKKQQEVFTYGMGSGDFHAEDVSIESNGTKFTLVAPAGKYPIWSPLLGRVNVYNLLAAAAAAYARNVEPKAIADAAYQLDRVDGRFQRVDVGQPFTVIVDYAHTDDALRNLTALARDFLGAARRRRTRHHGLRMRRRSRSQQASPDGRRSRRRQRLRDPHQRQSAQRESDRHHERRAARLAAQRHQVHART